MLFRIKKGLDLPTSGEPEQHEHASPAIQSVGLLGADYVNLKPRMLVDVGEQVRRGQAVVADRQDPQTPNHSTGLRYDPRDQSGAASLSRVARDPVARG